MITIQSVNWVSKMIYFLFLLKSNSTLSSSFCPRCGNLESILLPPLQRFFFFKLEKWQVDIFYWTHGRTEGNQLEWNPRGNKCPPGQTRSEHWPTQLDCSKNSVGMLKRLVKTESVKPKGGFFFSPGHKVRESPWGSTSCDPGPGEVSICHHRRDTTRPSPGVSPQFVLWDQSLNP